MKKHIATTLRSLRAAGQETELSKAGPFTLFAATDLAFGKLANGEIPELLKPANKVKLADLGKKIDVNLSNRYRGF